jgi:hypothetical protein
MATEPVSDRLITATARNARPDWSCSRSLGENVMLDPDGMSPARLAELQQVVADHPEWLGKVLWGS